MKFLTRAMAAAALVSMVATTSVKADVPDIGTVGTSDVLIAAATGTLTITFLHSRAALTNNLVLFTSTNGQLAVPTGGTTYPNPLISVPGNYPNVGVGVPLTFDIQVTAGQTLLFGICTSGVTGSTNSACSVVSPTATAYYMGQASNNNDNALHAVVLSAAAWRRIRPVSSPPPAPPWWVSRISRTWATPTGTTWSSPSPTPRSPSPAPWVSWPWVWLGCPVRAWFAAVRPSGTTSPITTGPAGTRQARAGGEASHLPFSFSRSDLSA